MKKLLIFSALASSLFLGACSNRTGLTQKNDITAADVPANVMSNFNASYPDAVDVRWEREDNDGRFEYEATFKQGDDTKRVEYDEAGNVTGTPLP